MDGAIHRAGGPAILEECRRIRARQGSLPAGEAVITTGGSLMAGSPVRLVRFALFSESDLQAYTSALEALPS